MQSCIFVKLNKPTTWCLKYNILWFVSTNAGSVLLKK